MFSKKDKKKFSDTDKQVQSFTGAVKKAEEIEELKEKAEPPINRGGRPMQGKTKANIPVRFVISEEVDKWLESMTDRKHKTPSAVAKKILMAQYELQNNS